MILPSYFIGCDLGTTATKTGIFDTEGKLVALARRNSNLIYGQDGSVIQEPYEMLESVVETVREVMEKSQVPPQEVGALALDGQMAGIMGVDELGEPATPYDSWLDVRSAPYALFMKQKGEELIATRSGMAPSINHGPKILWWKNEYPDVYRKIAKFTVPSCWVTQKLAGMSGAETFIDYTYLHFSCFADLKRAVWDKDLITLFEVEEQKFPRIVDPWMVVGKLRKDWAEKMGLLAGTPLVAGCGDQAANNLGAGIVETGMAFDVAGTASCFSLYVDRYVPDTRYRTLLFPRAVLRDYYYPMAYINGGGLDLEWAKNEFFRDIADVSQVFALIDKKVEEAAPSPSPIVFIPHLRGRNCPGEPYFRGVFAGFSWEHKREHLFRAILEGIAFEYAYYLKIIREAMPEIRFFEVRVIGGGAKSSLWNRIKASILGIPYVELDRGECAIWGAAMLAGFGVGAFSDLKEKALRSVNKVRVHHPDSGMYDFYQKLLSFYLEVMDKMGGVFHKHQELFF